MYPEWRENPQVRHSGGLGRGKGSQASATDGARPSQLGEQPAAQRWPEVLGSEEGGWRRATRELCLPARRTGIFIAPVFLDLSPPGFMRSVAVACVCGGGGTRGARLAARADSRPWRSGWNGSFKIKTRSHLGEHRGRAAPRCCVCKAVGG